MQIKIIGLAVLLYVQGSFASDWTVPDLSIGSQNLQQHVIKKNLLMGLNFMVLQEDTLVAQSICCPVEFFLISL